MLPTVSLIVPTYNAAGYIRRALDSALSQTYPNIEVLVVDDGSTDHTAALLQQHYGQDQRVRYIHQANAGPSVARNRGVREAQGEFIHFLDADEWLLPTKIEQSYTLFQQQPEIGVAYGHGIPVQPDGVTEIPMDYPPLPSGWVLCEWLKGTMAGGRYGVTSSFMVRRQAVIEVGGFPEDQRVAEDWDLWLRLAAKYPFAALAEKLVYYHRLPDGLHVNRLKMALGRLQTFERARHYAGREQCLSDAEYERMLAGRWHVVGTRYQEIGQYRDAKQAFGEALRLDARPSRVLYYGWAAARHIIHSGSK